MEDPFAELTRGAADSPKAAASPFEAITLGTAGRRRRNLALYIGVALVLIVALFLALRACGGMQGPLPEPNPTPVETRVNLLPEDESPPTTPSPTPSPTPTEDLPIDGSAGISDEGEDDDTVVLVVPNEEQDVAVNEAVELDPRFQTCGAAVAAGFGNYRAGIDPEYAWYSDRDGDGVVCER